MMNASMFRNLTELLNKITMNWDDGFHEQPGTVRLRESDNQLLSQLFAAAEEIRYLH
jgi:hypothetical protein